MTARLTISPSGCFPGDGVPVDVHSAQRPELPRAWGTVGEHRPTGDVLRGSHPAALCSLNARVSARCRAAGAVGANRHIGSQRLPDGGRCVTCACHYQHGRRSAGPPAQKPSIAAGRFPQRGRRSCPGNTVILPGRRSPTPDRADQLGRFLRIPAVGRPQEILGLQAC